LKAKLFRLKVDEFIVYEKEYLVKASSKKEAKAKFHRGDWLDTGELDSTHFDRAVVRNVKLEGGAS